MNIALKQPVGDSVGLGRRRALELDRSIFVDYTNRHFG
jgi:hypothetical protein